MRKLAEALFESGASNAAAEILPYELITAGEALSLLPPAFIAALLAQMPPKAAAAVFGLLMPLSLRAACLGELHDDEVRQEIVGQCGGASLGGVAPHVVAAMLDPLDTASVADALGAMSASDAASVLVGMLRGIGGEGNAGGGGGGGAMSAAARVAAVLMAMDVCAAASTAACMPPAAAAVCFDAAPTAAAAAIADRTRDVVALGKIVALMDTRAAGMMLDLCARNRNARVLCALVPATAGAVAAAMNAKVLAMALCAMHARDAALVLAAIDPATAGSVLRRVASLAPATIAAILVHLDEGTAGRILTFMPADAAGAVVGALASMTAPGLAADDPSAPTPFQAAQAAAVLRSLDADVFAVALHGVAVAAPSAAAAALCCLSAAAAARQLGLLASGAAGAAVSAVFAALEFNFVSCVLTHMSSEALARLLRVLGAEHAGRVLADVMVASASDLTALRRVAASAVEAPTSSPARCRSPSSGDDEEEEEAEKEEEVPDFTGYPAAQMVAPVMALLEANVAVAALRAMPPQAAAAVLFVAIASDLFSTSRQPPPTVYFSATDPATAAAVAAAAAAASAGFTSRFTDSVEASAALVALLDPDHVGAAAIVSELPVALAVRVFDQILQLSSTSQLSLHGARFGREIRPYLASRVRQSLADAEQLRKARDAIDALREMAAEVAAGDEWRHRVDRSVRLRELHRAMGWMLARMPDTLGDIKDFTGDPDRASVGIVAGLLLATLGDVAARELRRATVAAATTPWDSVGAEGGIGVNDGLTVSVGSLRPAYDLPVDPAALATMWTALTAIITVESPPSLPPSPSPHEFAASPVRGDSGSFSLDSGSRPATPVSPSPLMSGASSPQATTPRRRAKCSVESMATLQARVMEPDNHELDAEM